MAIGAKAKAGCQRTASREMQAGCQRTASRLPEGCRQAAIGLPAVCWTGLQAGFLHRAASRLAWKPRLQKLQWGWHIIS